MSDFFRDLDRLDADERSSGERDLPPPRAAPDAARGVRARALGRRGRPRPRQAAPPEAPQPDVRRPRPPLPRRVVTSPVRFVLGLDRDGGSLFGDTERPEHEIVSRVIETGEPILIGSAPPGGGSRAGGRRISVLSRSSCICVPLDSHRGRIGAVFVDRVVGGDDLNDEDLLVARLVAVQASQSIELIRLEEEKREADRVGLENDHLRRLSRRTADEARVIEELNRELKGRTEKLTAATAFLSGILESSTEYAIIATDLSGNINTWNAGAVRIYGFSATEVVGCARLDALFCDADKSRGLFREIVEAASGPAGRYEGEVKRLRKDQTAISVHAAATAIRNADGELTGYLDVSRDITRECEMRRQMLLAEKMAALGTLCAGVAHEFNNLLQGIVGFLEHAQQSGDDAVKERAISVSLSGARRAADLTRQLQAVARPAVSRPAPVALSELVSEALALVEKSFASEGVDLVAEHVRVRSGHRRPVPHPAGAAQPRDKRAPRGPWIREEARHRPDVAGGGVVRPFGAGHRLRDVARDPAADLRAVLHDQGSARRNASTTARSMEPASGSRSRRGSSPSPAAGSSSRARSARARASGSSSRPARTGRSNRGASRRRARAAGRRRRGSRCSSSTTRPRSASCSGPCSRMRGHDVQCVADGEEGLAAFASDDVRRRGRRLPDAADERRRLPRRARVDGGRTQVPQDPRDRAAALGGRDAAEPGSLAREALQRAGHRRGGGGKAAG